ncbi:hypothetical protein [Candidatus Reidiella endopervernicosa]|uniref:Uncharacterized protein n=1 Tax=Candidatus Reidiella endopervernicosa TaxID=2738883 RepID=A0A6N0HR83_9GAMM|nr:hypothetical protein [Candidatus Reidiella endopervernicosa]QKQ24836.1 hypothetical protein HUE57_13590 [Candidatus Reidiella endopervernicosa]
MLSQQIYTTAHMVIVMGHAGQRGKLLDLVEEYELTLNILENGGVVNESVEMTRVPGTVLLNLLALKAIWKETRPVIENISMHSTSKIEIEKSYQNLKESTARLTEASNELVGAYKSRTYKLRREMSAILMFCVVVAVISLFVVVVVRRYDKERIESERVLRGAVNASRWLCEEPMMVSGIGILLLTRSTFRDAGKRCLDMRMMS